MQSLSAVTVSGADVTGVDFGFNFDTIVNVADAGQGSLRQFITNANQLGNAGLAQAGRTAGEEASLFMISDGAAHPGLRAGLPNQLTGGVATISLGSVLPTLSDSNTSVDGTTQTANVGQTNPGVVGTGGTVGVDAIPLPQYERPEVAIDANGPDGFWIGGGASNILIKGIAIYDADDGVDVFNGAGTNRTIDSLLIGTLPDGSDPGAQRNTRKGVSIRDGGQIEVTRCYIGWNAYDGIEAENDDAEFEITYSEVFASGWNCIGCDGIDLNGASNVARYNLVRDTTNSDSVVRKGGGKGFECGSQSAGTGNHIIENNTIRDNLSAGIGIRNGSTGVTAHRNILHGNEVGIAVDKESSGQTNHNTLTENSIYQNDGLGIDLHEGVSGDPYDGVTKNDSGDTDSGSNDLMNFAVVTTATLVGTDLVLDGFARPASVIEFFIADPDPTGFGEGKTYLLTRTEGAAEDTDGGTGTYTNPVNGLDQGTDTTNRFTFTAPAPPGVVVGSQLTATARDAAGSTSEFSGLVTVESSILGTVFEDADFMGTASGYDGGAGDKALQGVDIELYNGGTDAYITSTVTAADGSYIFPGLSNGNYKVRARSATIGSGTATPLGGLNGAVPGTWPYPLPEMTWGNGTVLYGGQSATSDDTTVGDNLGPGDTYVTVTVSGADVTGVDIGFAYNLIVNTADDALADSARSQQGSLRQFIKNANGIATAGGTTASASQFRVPAGLLEGNGVAAIATVAALPVVSDASGGTTIDGTTQTINVGDNNASGPEVQIDGAGAGNIDGLVILSAGNTVRGLIVNGFDQALRGGVKITGASATGNTVAGSYIGTDHAGTASMPLRRGVIIDAGAQSNTIGGKTVADRNVISGNTEFGVFLSGSGTDFNTIEGNFIGTDAAGTSPLANQYGVYVTGGPQSNLIGGDTSDERNVISGNTLRGIILVGVGTDSNTISGNHIGLDVNGTAPVPNATGIQIVAASQSNAIGGILAGERNVVSGNTSTGIEIGNATLTEIRGNYIGTDVNGTAPLANGLGVSVLAGSTSNTIGGTDTADRNVISGNSLDGIWITGAGTSANTVLGNFIGTDSSGTNPLANGESGIEIKNSASGNTIGGTAAGSGNVISGNTLNGVAIFSSASGNFVLGNFIGTDPGGTFGVGNGTNGVLIFVDATSNTIGGTGPGEANVIGHNGGDGVYVDDAGTDNNSISGNSIFNNGGLGIDLDPNGVGTGTGANDDKAAPTIVSIAEVASDFRAIATVGAGDTIEFFRVNNAAAPAVVADPSGSGEGFLFLGNCVDNGACSGPHVLAAADADAAAGTVQATLLATGINLGDEVAATATDVADNTSEFSSNAEALPPLRIIKRAFQSRRHPGPQWKRPCPQGMPVKFMLYINNPGGGRGRCHAAGRA